MDDKFFGISTSIDLVDCDKSIITSPREIQRYINELCALIDMKKFGDSNIVYFGNEFIKGYSFTQLIETSLISGHFCDAKCAAYIDIFSCKVYDFDEAVRFTEIFFIGKLSKYNVNIR